MILAIDPGSKKCGFAVLDETGQVLESTVLERIELPDRVPLLLSKHGISIIIIGRSAFGKAVERELIKLEIKASFIFIPEKDSTRQARERYWTENPPAGLWKFIPTSLRVPPVPIDNYAAVILGERFLNKR